MWCKQITPSFIFTRPFLGHWDGFLATEATSWMLRSLGSRNPRFECILTKEKTPTKNILTTYKMLSDFYKEERSDFPFHNLLASHLQPPPNQHTNTHIEKSCLFSSLKSHPQSLLGLCSLPAPIFSRLHSNISAILNNSNLMEKAKYGGVVGYDQAVRSLRNHSVSDFHGFHHPIWKFTFYWGSTMSQTSWHLG